MTPHIDEWTRFRAEEEKRWLRLVKVLAIDGNERRIAGIWLHAVIHQHSVDPAVLDWVFCRTIRWEVFHLQLCELTNPVRRAERTDVREWGHGLNRHP